jgi:hypothetical protein
VLANPPFFPPIYFTTQNGCDFPEPCSTQNPLQAQEFNCLSNASSVDGCLLQVNLPQSIPTLNYNLTIYLQSSINKTTGFNCEYETYHYSAQYPNETASAYCQSTNSTASIMMGANYGFPPFSLRSVG